MELPLNYAEIVKILPHRYPFLLVDRITELELNKKIVGIKNVTVNEPFFQGHFPNNPIMPGVLIIEAMAQVGGILARVSLSETTSQEFGDLPFFMAIDKVRFRKPVVPGDQIVFEVTPLRTGTKVWKVAGKASVADDLVAEAELVARVG